MEFNDYQNLEGVKIFWYKSYKDILNGLPNPIKVKLEKCSSTKYIWENIQDLHSKGLLVKISDQQDSSKELKDNLELENTTENKDEGTNYINEEDEEEKSELEIEIDLKTKFVASLEEICNLKNENEEIKKWVQNGDHDLDKTNEEVVLFKPQLQERDEELNNIKE